MRCSEKKGFGRKGRVSGLTDLCRAGEPASASFQVTLKWSFSGCQDGKLTEFTYDEEAGRGAAAEN